MIDGKSEFACVDGPGFDGHRVNFEVLVERNATYRDAEQRSMQEFRAKTKGATDEPTSRKIGEKWGTQKRDSCVASSSQGEAR